MSDDLSKRDLQRDVDRLKQQDTTSPSGAFKTEDGDYVDKDGNPIDDLSSVIFVIPPGVWKQWEADDLDLGINVT